jgi:hypothetical protein
VLDDVDLDAHVEKHGLQVVEHAVGILCGHQQRLDVILCGRCIGRRGRCIGGGW